MPDDRKHPMRDRSEVDWQAEVGRLAQVVYAVCNRFGLQQADVEEAFQDTWRIALDKPEVPADAGMPRWIAAIAAWCARDVRRRRRRELAASGDLARDVPDPDEPRPEDVVAAVEREAAVRAALATLPEEYRRVIEEHYLGTAPLTHDELARRLGQARGSVSRRLRKALDELRRRLREVDPWFGRDPDEGAPGD